MKNFKKVLLVSLSFCSLAVFAQEIKKVSTKVPLQKSEKVVYTCPMHKEVSAAKPGNCAKCGMALKATEKIAPMYTCPMHADITSTKPGKCSKCGMALKATEKVQPVFACPMHADITSAMPGKCSKCGMALIEKKAAHTNHQQ